MGVYRTVQRPIVLIGVWLPVSDDSPCTVPRTALWPDYGHAKTVPNGYL